jgi:RNA polymerase sigma-70 factor (ECF subfamily)
MLTKLTHDPDRAEDLAQDTLIVVLRRMQDGGIREPDKLSAFIFSTARYLHIGWLRKHINKMEAMGGMEDFECLGQKQEDALQATQDAELIRRSLLELRKPRDREILMRSYLADQPKQEVCEALLLSTDHYDRVISRARQRLKEIAERSDLQLINEC